jgi:PAS domain S-box-containing protein
VADPVNSVSPRRPQASDGLNRTLFDYAPDGIVIADRESYYIDVNKSMCRMMGYTREEFIGLHASDIVVPDEVQHIGSALHAIKTRSDYHREWQFKRKDGSVFPAEVIATEMPDGNLLGMIRDLTERRTLEEQFQQALKMEAVGRLAGGIAHDFNNVLTVILGYCELLLADLDPNDPRHAEIGQIQKAGVTAACLTGQLLAFSRKAIIEPKPLDLNGVVADIRAMLGRLIGENVTIVLDLPPDLALVTADRGQMEQIVLNLALNARDAMPDGGTLKIETANVELDEAYARAHLSVSPGAHVMLVVTDTGTGMTPQVQEHMFEPFFTTREAGKGTGFGLATVHGIVARAGGSVTVDSAVGRGTSFRVYFPRANATEDAIVQS